jgi:hypothetical protein
MAHGVHDARDDEGERRQKRQSERYAEQAGGGLAAPSAEWDVARFCDRPG